MKKFTVIVVLLLFLFSCTSDNQTALPNLPVNFNYYTINTTTVSSQFPTYYCSIVGNLQNNKLLSTTTQYFSNGISQGAATTVQEYFYNGNLLIKIQLFNNGTKDLFLTMLII